MAAGISAFLDQLKVAATGPYALTGYVALIGAWTYVAISTVRIKTISRALKMLPEADRLKLLLKEYNTEPRAGLSAEQWLKSRKQTLLFLGFLALVIALLIVVLTALARASMDPNAKAMDDYVRSLSDVLVHADADFSDIKGEPDAKLQSTWDSSFYLRGVPCKIPEIVTDSGGTSYECDILEDDDLTRAKPLFDQLVAATQHAAVLKGWTFENTKDADEDSVEWDFVASSPNKNLEIDLTLYQMGTGNESADLDFSAKKIKASSTSLGRRKSVSTSQPRGHT